VNGVRSNVSWPQVAVVLASLVVAFAVAAGCSGGSGGSSPGGSPGGPATVPPTIGPTTSPTQIPTGPPSTPPTIGPTAAPISPALVLPANFYGETIAAGLSAPRQLVALPNGDLLAGSNDKSNIVYIIPNAEAKGAAGTPHVFVTLPNGAAQGVAIDPSHNNLYVATNQSVWRVPYHAGDTSEPTSAAVEVAKLRRGIVAPNSDGDVHFTSSAAVTATTLYVGVGSSCNACTESDPTRATIQQIDVSTLAQSTKAVRFRNALAVTVNPATGTVWAGGAGQDGLMPMNGAIVLGVSDPRQAHPYEFFDPVSLRAGVPDYGWPVCEENDHLYNPQNTPGASCTSSTNGAQKDVVPAVVFLAYSTVIGATFYPLVQTGTYAFPSGYHGGAFVAMHGSWHEDASGRPLSQPDVAFVPMSGDVPSTAVNWNDSTAQWSSFLYGFQDTSTGNRLGRPVGLAIGPQGSLFIADDFAGTIYRIRPGTGPSSVHRTTR
jgi:glucose/arabinose dehydrogenase